VNKEALRELLEATQVIAVVGMSNRPGRPAHEIPRMLLEDGFTVIPVNPTETEILGQHCYPRLADVPGPIDMVDVFRRSSETPDVARQAAAVGAKSIWLQLGITSDESRSIAEAAGMTYVEDLCLGVVARGLGIKKS
jgi:predicted CoA-binding protein